MALGIVFNQAAKPPGVVNFAREDLATGTPVSVALSGGPFVGSLITIKDKPIDLSVPVQSNAVVVAPTSASTLIQPVDLAGTYLIRAIVDQGFGLGARLEDQIELTFYAGPPLATQWDDLPRREPAFGEKTHHNVKGDPIFGSLGNLRGWAQEWLRWFGVLKRHDSILSGLSPLRAFARVSLPVGGPASVVAGGLNVASATRLSLGTVRVTFTAPLATDRYVAGPTARGATGGACTARSELTTDFIVERGDPFGALVDADFNVIVVGG